MKTLELDLKKKILIVEYRSVEVMNDTIYSEKLRIELDNLTMCASVITHDLICKGSELTELIAYKLVKENSRHGTNTSFVNYKGEKSFFFALESFISAIEAQGYYWGKNPLEKPIKNSFFKSEQFNEKEDEFKDAQSRTFNLEKTLIFEIL